MGQCGIVKGSDLPWMLGDGGEPVQDFIRVGGKPRVKYGIQRRKRV